MSWKTQTCGSCKYYVENKDVTNLSAPKTGVCRYNPPVFASIIGPGPNPGTIASQIQVIYPTIPGNFPACSKFEMLISTISTSVSEY